MIKFSREKKLLKIITIKYQYNAFTITFFSVSLCSYIFQLFRVNLNQITFIRRIEVIFNYLVTTMRTILLSFLKIFVHMNSWLLE